ncbi:tetratricopeptide repeat protein [Streptomyces formicae]|uniref:Tetratricopeptide repeat protein n=1 Tax=Streptomyces formicae TaxID=1616117 RepID=A0ABY3WW79_9ACTN|nr:tetratricopeptide repeat protein [Streptomyces formicae]UNM15072.1 tetratricopeptide repeat protein [Streptomyces formicae]
MRGTHAAVALAVNTGFLTVLFATAAIVSAFAAVRRIRSHHPAPGPPATVATAAVPEADPVPVPAADLTFVPELPPPIPDFTGRFHDLACLLRLADDGHRTIVVTGAPGTGKTALAVRLAHELRTRFPDGALYAELGAGRGDPAPPAAVLGRFLAALGAPAEERTGRPAALAARFRSRTRSRRILLLLDDAADAAQLRPLLPAGDTCLTVITARRAVTDLPGAVPFALAPLTEPDALALWAAPRPLVHACGRLPLALRVAAAAGPARAGRLAAERARLDALGIGDPGARAAFETGYAALDAADRHLLRALAAYPGARITATVAAAAADRQPADSDAGLARLAAAQLVEAVAPGTYRLHDLIRGFAAERLERDTTPADRRAARARLLAVRPADPAAVSALVRAGVREGLHAEAYRLATTADERLREEPCQSARLAMWTALLDAARRAGEQLWVAHALRALGDAHRREGRYDQAVDHLRMSLAVQRPTDGTRGDRIEPRLLLGDALRRAGRYEEALRELRTALHTATGDAEILTSLGELHLDRRRPDEAIPCLEAAFTLTGSADTERHLGTAYARAGNLPAAEHHLRSALAAHRQRGCAAGEGWTLRELGHLDEQRFAFAQGAAHHRAALSVFARADHGLGVAAAAEALGDNLLAQGDEVAADTEYRRAAAAYADFGDPVREAEARRKLSAP